MKRKSYKKDMLRAVGDEAFGFRVKELKKSRYGHRKCWRMEFVQNGAEVVWIEKESEDKTFAIAFRTLPEDDSGVAHIIEHSVLCGSEKFRVKSPFAELSKCSLSTYLNAYTQADATVYPVSSCNEKEIFNVAEVYLDAVFAPLSMKNDWAMPQERNIVFNEMKGAMSSPGSIAIQEIGKMLFPSNVYGRNSGGDPEAIRGLTMERYRQFYMRFYHPSNALVFLYGEMDIEKMLKLVASYFVRYPRRDIPARVQLQMPVSAQKTIEYPCTQVADHTRLYEGWVVGTWRDVEKRMAMEIVCEILSGSNNAPLRKALLDAGVCESLRMTCYAGQQNHIIATFVNVRDGKLMEARRIFYDALARQIKEGFDVKQISAGLDKREYSVYEPELLDSPGIGELTAALDNWLYADSGRKPGVLSVIKSLRRRNGTGYFERLANKAIINNHHHASLTLKPIVEQDTEHVIEDMTEVSAPEDSPSELAKIPRLQLSDIPNDGVFTSWEVAKMGGVEVVRPQVEVYGITYATLAFAVDDLTDEELLDLPLLGRVLGHVPVSGMDMPSLRRGIDSLLGRFCPHPVASWQEPYFLIPMSFLVQHATDAIQFIKRVLSASDFSCSGKIDTIRKQHEIALYNWMLSSGADVATIHAARNLSATNRIRDFFEGLAQYRHLRSDVCGNLAKLALKVFSRNRLTMFVVNPPDPDFVRKLVEIVPEGVGWRLMQKEVNRRPELSDVFATSGGGTFTAMCTQLPNGVTYSGTFALAAQILTQEYLWNKVRVNGGAYGSAFIIDHFGRISLKSWNDPNPVATFDTFANCGNALRAFAKSGCSMDGYKIALCGDIAAPSEAKAILAFTHHLEGISTDDLNRWRSEILHATAEDLLKFADILEEVLPTATRCAIGEDALVRECGLTEFKMKGR